MERKLSISPQETIDWLVKVATADGLLSPNEQSVIREFADQYGINVDELLQQATNALDGNKPEVEIIDYRVKNGLLFEQLIVSFLKDKSRFQLLSWTGDKFVEGIYDRENLNPDLHIQQIINGKPIDYYIECKWHHFWQRGERDYFYEMRPWQLERYRKFQRTEKRVVLVAYAYGRTGSNPRGIYLVPLHAFRECKLHKSLADRQYRIEPTAQSFAQYMENYFTALFTKKNQPR